MRTSQIINRIVNGEIPLDAHLKYSMISFFAAFIHFIFMILFELCDVKILFVYNIFATIFYLYHGFVSVRKNRFFLIYASSLIEILFHSGLASILLGTGYSFMVYTIALIPVCFYLPYTMPKYTKNMKLPMLSSCLIVIYYVFISIVTSVFPPLFTGYINPVFQTLFFYVNNMVSVALLLFFSMLFMLEIYYMQGQLERENLSLGEIANFDSLTHLLNRHSMNNYLLNAWDEAITKGNVFSLIMADIDDFKKVNDTYGHACGDLVLKEVSNVIKSSVRNIDYVCRWGGEEILILVQGDLSAANSVANRICKEIAAHTLYYENRKLHVTLTLGVSTYQKQPTIAAIIAEADNNLYKGKRNGKNQVYSLDSNSAARL